MLLIGLLHERRAPKLFDRLQDAALSHQKVDRENKTDPDVKKRASHVDGRRQNSVQHGRHISHDIVQSLADRVRDLRDVDFILGCELIQLHEQILR